MEPNTLLIVDDEKKVLKAIERVLRKKDYDIHSFLSPIKALESIENIKPQVIISDRRMPHMDGLDFLTRVKEKYPECYCILMTGYSYVPESVKNALQEDRIDFFIKKPIDDNALMDLIEKAFADRDAN